MQTSLHDLKLNNVPKEKYLNRSRESKESEIKTKGFDKTFFIYEKNTDEVEVLWKFLTKIHSGKFTKSKATKSEYNLNPKNFLSKKSILFIAVVIIAPEFFDKRNVVYCSLKPFCTKLS